MADRLPPSAEEYQFITTVSSEYGVPIRRASELYYNSPDMSTSVEASKIMRKGLEATLGRVSTYCFTQFEEQGIDSILDAHQREIQVYPKIDVYNSIWTGIPDVDTRDETPFVNSHDFLSVTTSDSARRTLETVRDEHEDGSIPIAMHDAVLMTSEKLGISSSEAMGFLMKFLEKSFPALASYSAGLVATLENSRLAFQGLIRDYESVLGNIRETMDGGVSLQEASRQVLRGFHDSIPSIGTTAAALVLDEQEVRGIRDVCKIQRRPYSDSELEVAQTFVEGSKPFTDAVTAFHYLMTDYSRNYFASHPERMQYTFRDFNTLLLVYRDETRQIRVGPNPDMLSSFSDNWFGSIARAALQRQRNEGVSNNVLSEYNLTPNDIQAGIVNAKKESAFRMRIGMFNTGEQGDILWHGNMFRVCPAEKITTDSAAEVIPKLYETLLTTQQKAGAGNFVAATRGPEDIDHRSLADTLVTRLQATDTMLFITGEASTGKTRITQELSRLTGLPVIDVGLGYRLAAYLANEESLNDLSELSARMHDDFTASTIDGECRIFDQTGEDVTDDLRTSTIDQQAGSVGPECDELILNFLRAQMKGPHLVAARNTALAGKAKSMQVMMTCELQERARRRAKQANRSDVEAVFNELRMREEKSARHYTNDLADIIEIDTTNLDPESATIKLMKEANAQLI